ncbi:hypothetical protein T12_16869 [Trichinella patagoniensis]|uniref:Uncharacterized protein n=1 Tax=Trichinella patagoniensis TaxID=990121 RepID=A0A0V0Z156_9BILA|nr:hypothetical protein T12_16869 [Trichinella patagoniensis]
MPSVEHSVICCYAIANIVEQWLTICFSIGKLDAHP